MISLCTNCGQHYLNGRQCPSCSSRAGRASLMTSMLLGIGLTACGDKSEETDTSSQQAEDTSVEQNVEPPYGVGALDEDGDGSTAMDDCDDNNPNTYPGAAFNEVGELSTACLNDDDGDGYGDINDGPHLAGTDCDDDNASIHPAATELEGDGVDSNCNAEDDR